MKPTPLDADPAVLDKGGGEPAVVYFGSADFVKTLGVKLTANGDIEVDKIAGRTAIFCGDKLSQCEFSKTKSSTNAHPGLPVKVVDEEIYHRPPTMMIVAADRVRNHWRGAIG